MIHTVFILDDEKDIVNLVIHHLQKNGFGSQGFLHPKDLLKTLKQEQPDLLLLDLMLPEISGLELCKRIKRDSRYHTIPIIMLTAKQTETDKVQGLELGADDYITKPFSPKELIARIKAVLRRVGNVQPADVITLKNMLTINFQKYEVLDAQNRTVNLTQTEYKILAELALRPGWVFSRQKLMNIIWGDDVYITERNIDVHIRHLREKLGRAGDLILNIRGVGYKIAE